MQITVVFAQYGSKLKIGTIMRATEDECKFIWGNRRLLYMLLPKSVKQRAWQDFSKMMRMPVDKLKKKYCLMGSYPMLISKSSIWMS